MWRLPMFTQFVIVFVFLFVFFFVIGMIFNWLFPISPEPSKPTKWREITEEERKKMIKDYCEKLNSQAEEFREIRRLYYDSLKSRDKSESVDLGKKFYGFNIKNYGYKYKQGGHTYLSFTPSISQEQHILLQIQTDILAHS
jgi:hypothetical protein